MADDFAEIREAVARLCADFPGRYWRDKDRARAYPQEFVDALSAAGYLAVLVPEQYGGSGLGIGAASAVLESWVTAGSELIAARDRMPIVNEHRVADHAATTPTGRRLQGQKGWRGHRATASKSWPPGLPG